MDVLLVETLNGGDVLIRGNDLARAEGFENMPYLALFGGNTEASTPAVRVAGEFNEDYWGNSIFMPKSAMANSDTERKLQNEALTSSGRVRIEGVVKKDLKFMQAFAEVSVRVVVISDDVVNINIRIVQPNNIQAREFQYIWDGTKLALAGGDVVYTPPMEGGYRLLENTFFRLLENGAKRKLEN